MDSSPSSHPSPQSRNALERITLKQDAEKVRQPVLFIGSVRSVWFVWLHETNQMDQTDQITRQTGVVPGVRTTEVLVCHNRFFAAC
jgi:hypothetical protein